MMPLRFPRKSPQTEESIRLRMETQGRLAFTGSTEEKHPPKVTKREEENLTISRGLESKGGKTFTLKKFSVGRNIVKRSKKLNMERDSLDLVFRSSLGGLPSRSQGLWRGIRMYMKSHTQ